jgi:hypothetical protein
MAIDSSIYSQIQTPDIIGSVDRGLKMRDLLDERQKNQSIKQAFTKGVSVGPDGMPKQDLGLTANELLKGGYGQEAMTIMSEKAKQDSASVESQLKKLEFSTRLLSGVKDQASWDQAKAVGAQYNLDMSKEPAQYDPNYVNSRMAMGLTAKDQIENQWKAKEFGLKEREIKAKEVEAAGKKIEGTGKLASELRKERSGLPTTKATQDVAAAYNKIQSAASKPSAAGDMALIFNYMKMLDPGSTVREGEYATAQQATNVPGQVVSMYNRILRGERLNETQRADFLNQSKGLYSSQLDVQKQIDSQFADLATKAGVDPKEVLLNFEANTPAPKAKTITQNGFTYTWNAKTGKYE